MIRHMNDAPLEESIFELSSAALAVLGDDGRVARVNRAALELPGLDVPALLEGRAPGADVSAFRAELQARGRASAAVSITGSDGAVHHVTLEGRGRVVVVRDTTAVHELEEELRQLRRVESVGYLTASLAHDFNNLLTVIACSTAILAREIHDRDRLFELAQEIQLATERATAMVRQLLARIRRTAAAPAPLDLNQAIVGLSPLLERLVGDGVEVHLALDDEVAHPVVDSDAFEHALLNLVVNARDAMPSGGRLEIATRNVELGEGAPAGVGGGYGARYVALAVTDTGSGMSREVRDRMFDRCFTTKERGRGSGLGLSMVQRFASQSGGCISVHSAPGQGTTIALYFPREQAAGTQELDRPADSCGRAL